MKKDEVLELLLKLEEMYPDAKSGLDFKNPYELLIATILSAQTTDVQVNKVTKNLFQKYPNPQKLSEAGLEDVISTIKTIGLYRNKAKNIILTAQILVNDFSSQVPKTMEELLLLPGVGRKTANVVLSSAFSIPSIAVDTHVFRVSNRLGISNSENVLDCEKELREKIPRQWWSKSHHLLIAHGRNLCKARGPLCHECSLKAICLYFSMVK